MRYRAGYRFQLAEPVEVATPIQGQDIGNAFVQLAEDGLLTIRAGYAWDGASGPVQQSPDIIRGSLVHDALYQLMRECGLSAEWRGVADELLRRMCIDDGMPEWQAGLVYIAVRALGKQYADGSWQRPVLTAPQPVSYPSLSEWTAP
ncbi:MAG TPA: hypothetical protein VEB22_04300 [Phycisphaerales bacterium]|nr:hypothetical protein [Phycisphaerales bacterium]